MSQTHPQHHIAFCLCPGMPLFCLVSALEVLRHANRLSQANVYQWSFITEADQGILDSNGLWLHPSTRIEKAPSAELILVVAGLEPDTLELPRLGAWLKQQAQQGATLGGISNGSFVLAELGLLDGYSATVHWEDFSSFYERYPQVNSRYQRFVMDGPRLSCSGGASTLDLLIELVHQQLGQAIAQGVARQMLLQDGTLNSHNTALVFDGSHRYSPRVQRILNLLDAHIEGGLTVQALAAKVGLSRRAVLRLLKQETGQTPSELLNARRLERARSLVQHSHLPLAEIATVVGFSSQSHFTQRYREAYGITPARERQH